jgi:hypothetical protein
MSTSAPYGVRYCIHAAALVTASTAAGRRTTADAGTTISSP